jgi:putative SOS response-associated peptidase YedK
MARQEQRRNNQVLHHDHYRAEQLVAEVHDRMPVLLSQDQFEPWLSGEAGLQVLKPAADHLLQRWPVSKRVNSSRAPDDGSTLIERIQLP